MADIAALAIAACLDALGETVTYTPPPSGEPPVAGAAVTLRALNIKLDPLTAPLYAVKNKTHGASLDVLVADLPAPERGAVVTCRRGTFTLRDFIHPDPDQLIWRLDLVP